VNNAEIHAKLLAAGEEITDEGGQVIGYVSQPARFKVEQPYLGLGGFLVVERDEATGDYIGTEFDALKHPKSGLPYPAGHSEQVFRVSTFEMAYSLVAAYFLSTPTNT
jgi:hypothetical protein